MIRFIQRFRSTVLEQRGVWRQLFGKRCGDDVFYRPFVRAISQIADWRLRTTQLIWICRCLCRLLISWRLQWLTLKVADNPCDCIRWNCWRLDEIVAQLQTKEKVNFSVDSKQWLVAYESSAHVKADIVSRMHNRIGQTDVEAITEHRNTKRCTQVWLIEAWKCSSSTAGTENCRSQISVCVKGKLVRWKLNSNSRVAQWFHYFLAPLSPSYWST